MLWGGYFFCLYSNQMACTMLPQEELKAYESQLMDSSDVLTSRQVCVVTSPCSSCLQPVSHLSLFATTTRSRLI